MNGAYDRMSAVENYECPEKLKNETCPNVIYDRNRPDNGGETYTVIQPEDLKAHIGCYTSTNLTKTLDLGLCLGLPQPTQPQPYSPLTSCIDDFDRIEMEPYIAYGTH